MANDVLSVANIKIEQKSLAFLKQDFLFFCISEVIGK